MAFSRLCGPCSACCYTHSIADLNEPLGTWCPHIMEPSGCGIYERRPECCKRFECNWLMGEMGNEHRPDILGIVFFRAYQPVVDCYCLTAAEFRAGAVEEAKILSMLRSLADEELILLLQLHGHAVPRLMGPAAELQKTQARLEKKARQIKAEAPHLIFA